MSTRLEQIEMLRKRVQVTYEEAKEAVDRFNGDMVEALVYLERNQKIKSQPENKSECGYGFVRWIKGLISKGNRTKFQVSKYEKPILHIPLTLLVLITIVAPYVTLVGLIIALFTEHSFRFVKPDGSNMEINKVLNKVSSAVDAAKAEFKGDKPEVL